MRKQPMLELADLSDRELVEIAIHAGEDHSDLLFRLQRRELRLLQELGQACAAVEQMLNLFTAEQRGRDARREVILYLTPHVWRPGLDVPLLRPDLPAVESHTLTPYEVPGFLGSAGTPE
jgi:hypothetical protein